MAYSVTDKRRVYLACRAIFTGQNAEVRKTKKIRELVSQHKTALHTLIKDFTIDKVVVILKDLLERKIFKSDIKAKIEFPELYHSSPMKDVQRTASEHDAAQSVAEVLEEITSQENNSYKEDENDNENENEDLSQDGASNQPAIMPSLYPSYFPYHTQHVIISKAQRVLEECCFEFTQKWMPSILSENGWDCPEAGELTKWTKIFARRSAQFPENAFKPNGKVLNDVLFSTNRLRHTAVHRLPTTSRGIESLIQSAMAFVEALQDTQRCSQLEELEFEINSKIRAMELNKNVLEDTLSQELQAIQQQREELDRREKELISKVISEDRDNKALIGFLLEESVSGIFEKVKEGVKGNAGDLDSESDDEETNGIPEAAEPVS